MITEQYVTFQTAQLLKEAWFDIPCKRLFLKDGCPGITAEEENHNDATCNAYSRPTQALAARWLREVHHIFIILTPMTDGWMYDLYDLKKYQYIILSKDAGIVTYEESFETALQETLRLIIKQQRR